MVFGRLCFRTFYVASHWRMFPVHSSTFSHVNCVHAGLVDEQQKVRTITALALAALAEAATPYGIESFDSVLKPLWKGIRQHRGKVSFASCTKGHAPVLQ